MARVHVSTLLTTAALLVAAACSDSMDHSASDGAQPVVVENDVQFVDAMVPHHEMAVMMADLVLANGSDPHTKEMAQTMKDAQIAEIAELKETRKRIAGSDEVPANHDPHMDADMDLLEGANGAELDRLFLEHMLPHHAGAIQIAHNALPVLKEANLKAMATNIIVDQSGEIGMIQEMLNEM
jgi:uncharacterized protein (DUF305 family)